MSEARAPLPRRQITSFVRRSTRMNPSQHKAWDTLSERYLIDLPRGDLHTALAPDQPVLDWPRIFGRAAPLVVEIGSGTGDNVAAMAAARPEVDFVAFEVFTPAVASTMSKLDRLGAHNARVLTVDAVDGLTHLFGPGSLSELLLFFPDPWHKVRHRKRRLVQATFADLVADRLVPGGDWYLATDWDDYAGHIRAVLDDHPRFANVSGCWAPRHPGRPQTRFEQRGVEAGRTVRDLHYRRLP